MMVGSMRVVAFCCSSRSCTRSKSERRRFRAELRTKARMSLDDTPSPSMCGAPNSSSGTGRYVRDASSRLTLLRRSPESTSLRLGLCPSPRKLSVMVSRHCATHTHSAPSPSCSASSRNGWLAITMSTHARRRFDDVGLCACRTSMLCSSRHCPAHISCSSRSVMVRRLSRPKTLAPKTDRLSTSSSSQISVPWRRSTLLYVFRRGPKLTSTSRSAAKTKARLGEERKMARDSCTRRLPPCSSERRHPRAGTCSSGVWLAKARMQATVRPTASNLPCTFSSSSSLSYCTGLFLLMSSSCCALFSGLALATAL
mmetsp:Transcript_53789/g.131479  ORF Transcript_53789/g.131479 Transcript_53789/m.131479 type:complete len:312 (+) Transcript_53789:2257-3192(+)